ncbi:MAG TPA: ubiquinone/menaquinone biosynthesis methyltransferase [Thermodesulfovibrio thiophilus]|nr:ubiquinone/menaquinone biosynthesis methyltransferase [Thermodesulfovibrio thiophilus]
MIYYDIILHMKETDEIKLMFDKIARRYDFLNHFLSFGLDFIWRGKMADQVVDNNTHLVLDLASGTGDSAIALLKRGVNVIGLDISFEMLKTGANKIKKKYSRQSQLFNKKISFFPVTGSGYQIPMRDSFVDAVTSAFGIRNMHDTEDALREIYRVIRPEGRVVILEFSLPESFIRKPYLFYLKKIIPVMASMLSVKSAYEYLGKSIEEFYKPSEFVRLLDICGFKNIKAFSLSFGCVYLYIGVK